MHVTNTDLGKFERMVRKAVKTQNPVEITLVNSKRGYVLCYLPHPDHFTENPKEVSDRVTAHILDESDYICEL